ncbi:hypothetical protein B0H19DRAFT_1066463 [Mycena capillaripes]|nr:hypothetical protein B0H19DRAFT_1066463 [Mycena capillaripes]
MFDYCVDRHRRYVPFPPQSTGFLYFHKEPNALPMEGSVRLRVTPDQEPSSFRRGHDLLLPSGCPWQVILPQIASQRVQTGFRHQLLHENLVTPEQLEQCRTVFGTRKMYTQFILFRATQEFPVHFGGSLCLTVVGNDKLHPLRFASLFAASHKKHRYFPWQGSALARFERSTSAEHRSVHLRITKIVNPSSYTVENYTGRILKPQEGELLTQRKYGHAPAPWAYDMDSQTDRAVAFRALWDNNPIS